MTDEQRAALTRLHRGDAELAIPAMMQTDENSKRIVRDIIAAAELALAEHPADDGEPITAEWLKSVGFALGVESDWIGFGDCTVLFKPQHYDSMNGHLRTAWIYQDNDGEESELPKPKTRGDLRRLCRALGVELREGGE